MPLELCVHGWTKEEFCEDCEHEKEIRRLEAKIQRLRSGYEKIVSASDSEMKDGDMARNIAKQMLTTQAAHDWRP